MTQRYKMVLSYDGTEYAGWQVQQTSPTVQATLEKAVAGRTGESPRVLGSGRTDARVHARGQVAHFDLENPIPAPDLIPGINAYLPKDVRVESVEEAAPDFHSQRSAIGKQYRYCIWNAPVMRAYLRNYRTHVAHELDFDAMRDAASRLVGTHDFTAYSANPNRPMKTNVRDLHRLDLEVDGPELCITAEGGGFLYKMVRSLAGFLIQVGKGVEPASEATVILEAKLRTTRVPTAHPQGLYLWEVYYP